MNINLCSMSDRLRHEKGFDTCPHWYLVNIMGLHASFNGNKYDVVPQYNIFMTEATKTKCIENQG